MYIICILYVYYMYIICILYVCYMYIICILYAYDMYIIARSPTHAPTFALETHLTYARTHHRLYVSGGYGAELR